MSDLTVVEGGGYAFSLNSWTIIVLFVIASLACMAKLFYKLGYKSVGNFLKVEVETFFVMMIVTIPFIMVGIALLFKFIDLIIDIEPLFEKLYPHYLLLASIVFHTIIFLVIRLKESK